MRKKLQYCLMVSAAALITANINVAAQKNDPAPVSSLVSQVDIPHEEFKLDNGLTVLVHEDRKAPIVAVSIWYDVGSKHEPKGKTGYAHLFEHIMFNGSENAPGDYFKYTSEIGATGLNGTTWLDRTNYFQNVPTSALESALFLESDRMGHLLGAISQEKLDNQIGVVSNEKRQGDNQPFGLVGYEQIKLLYPEGHPYAHSTIGSLEDLEAASLDDMKQWFIDNYGPNNAILVLAGDINTKEAKPLVEKWFGHIKPGKPAKKFNLPIPTLDKPVKSVLKDKVPTTRIMRSWVVPGLAQDDYTALDVGARALGGLASSRLDKILVREEGLAVSVAAFVQGFVHSSTFQIRADLKPGADANLLAKRMDEILTEFMTNGPTSDEVQRVATSAASNRIAGLEQIGGFSGKAVALAQGKLFAGDSNYYKKELERLAATKPTDVKAAMQKWLSRPVAEVWVEPGERETYQEVGAGKAQAPTQILSDDKALLINTPILKPANYSPIQQGDISIAASTNFQADRSKFPGAGEAVPLDLPTVEEVTLDNGIKVFFAKRDAVPTVRVNVSFDSGYASDPKDKAGLTNLMSNLMEEGTTSLTANQLSEAQESLGANVNVGASLDRTTASLTAVNVNLGGSLDLLADIIKNPSFIDKDLERVRVQTLNRIKAEEGQPQALAFRTLPPLVYGEAHPYGTPLTGSGYSQTVSAISREDIVNFHKSWIHPSKAEIFVVGDTSLAEIKKELNIRFGQWKPDASPAPAKNFNVALPEKKARILLVDKPNSPQSVIVSGQVLGLKGKDDQFTLRAGNEVFGGSFLSRINFDLRETKGWSYGVRSLVFGTEDLAPFMVLAPVQTNQTGPSVEALLGHIASYNSDKPVTAEELDRVLKNNTLSLPGRYETSGAVLGQMQTDRLNGRGFDYAETLADRYKKLTGKEMNDAFRKHVDAKNFTWLIVGDVAKIKPQLEKIGLPIEIISEDAR